LRSGIILETIFKRGSKIDDFNKHTKEKKLKLIPKIIEKITKLIDIFNHPRNSRHISMSQSKQSSKGALTLSINKNISNAYLVHLDNTYYIWLESAVFCLETAKLVIFKDSNPCTDYDLPLTIFEAHEKMHTARFPSHITQVHNGLLRLGIKLIRLPKWVFFPSYYKIDEVWTSTAWDSNMRLHDVKVTKNVIEPQIQKNKNRIDSQHEIKLLKKDDEISKKLEEKAKNIRTEKKDLSEDIRMKELQGITQIAENMNRQKPIEITPEMDKEVLESKKERSKKI
jgi:hypothetical protein